MLVANGFRFWDMERCVSRLVGSARIRIRWTVMDESGKAVNKHVCCGKRKDVWPKLIGGTWHLASFGKWELEVVE